MSKKSGAGWWRVWAKAIGEKASPCDKESDKIAIVRTIIVLSYLVTNTFIIANAIRHWNGDPLRGTGDPSPCVLLHQEAEMGHVRVL